LANILSNQPDSWSVDLDEKFGKVFSGKDIKAELQLALHNHGNTLNDMHEDSTLLGIIVIVFSVFGLYRERDLKKFKEQLTEKISETTVAEC